MSPQQIELVRLSWQQVFPLRETAAQMFYERLFELDPSLRPLFKADLSQQAAKLFDTLNALVASLGENGALETVAGPLRRSHAGFAATPAQYEAVGEALMWTLQASVGKAFTTSTRVAWREAYAQLSAAMQVDRGAAAAPAPAR
ncbi:MAG TPA: globin domain-containing protein [Ideonella sp.]|uniref:globin domain-containing protein n=1 Tax=Ideonella sp. TaxID=1929293 RepID=UPI002BFAEEB5|nr:globin domain-containing protein [Ideonella sp.]HSI48773.1 globin domain-containing protein [Ideonella sp.]